MQSTSIDLETTLPIISEEQARQRAREIMGAKFAKKHSPISFVVAFSKSQSTVLELVVNRLLAATETLPSPRIVVHLDAFSASARQLAALSISIRRLSEVRHWPWLHLPALGDIQDVVAYPPSHPPPGIRAVTLTWRDPNWVLDFFVPIHPPAPNLSPTASSGWNKAKGAKETASCKKKSRAQKRKLAQEQAKRARAARDAARRADPVYKLEKYLKTQKAKDRKLAMEKGLIAGKRDPAPGSQILRSNAKIVPGGLPGLGKRR